MDKWGDSVQEWAQNNSLITPDIVCLGEAAKMVKDQFRETDVAKKMWV